MASNDREVCCRVQCRVVRCSAFVVALLSAGASKGFGLNAMQMKRLSTRRFLASAVAIAGVLGTTVVLAADAPITLSLFKGQVGEAANLVLGGWGSGKAETTKEGALVGQFAVRVTTQNLFSGARLDFPAGINLADALKRQDTFLRFQMRFPGGSGGGFPGAASYPGAGGGGGGGKIWWRWRDAVVRVEVAAATNWAVVARAVLVRQHSRRCAFLFTMADGKRYEVDAVFKYSANRRSRRLCAGDDAIGGIAQEERGFFCPLRQARARC